MPDVLDKSGKVVGRYDYTPEGRKRAKAHADKIGGTVKKKFTDTHPHGMYSTTRSTGLKTIKPEKKKVYKKILKKKAPKAVDIAKGKKPRSMKKGGTVKETGIYKLHKGEKVVPVKKKKKTEPKLRPQPEWEMSDFQWVPDPDKAGSLKLRYTESGVKKKAKKAPKAVDIAKGKKPRS